MADQGSIANLKQNINENIYQNDDKDISGGRMNTILLNIVDTLNFNGRDFFNVNDYREKSDAYANAAAARAAVPDEVKKLGLVITYLLADGWIIDEFIGDDINDWAIESNWETIGPIKIIDESLSIGSEIKGELAGKMIENPDFIYVIIDSNDNIVEVKHNKIKESCYKKVISQQMDFDNSIISGNALLFPVQPNKIYNIISKSNDIIYYAFLKNSELTTDNIISSKSLLEPFCNEEVLTPSDCLYIYVDHYIIPENIMILESNKVVPNYNLFEDLKSKIVFSINKSLRYTFNTVIPNQYPGYEIIPTFGGSGEPNIRPMAQVCFTVGTQLYNGKYDSFVTYHSIYDAKNQLKRLVLSLINWHRAIKGNVDYAWGRTWQSALWAYYIGVGAILNKDLFTATEWAKVVTVLEYEADVQVNKTNLADFYWMDNDGQPYGDPGDTKLEEVDWNNAVIGIALIVTTNSQKIAQYKAKFIEKSLIGQSMPGDYLKDESINGYPLSYLQGYNLREDAVAINHGIVHPSYSVDAYCSLFGAVACMMYLNKPIPKATWFNQDKIVNALINRDFTEAEGYNPPYGTIYKPATDDIYYPQGMDWGIVLGITQVGVDVIAHYLSLKPDIDWLAYANVHMNRVMKYQGRWENGKYYGPGENILYPAYYENETYEPTKLCICLAFMLKPVLQDDSDWLNLND